jgi:hypothetical protein
MQNHNNSHYQRSNVHEARGALKNNRIGELDIPRITIRLDADPKLNS